MKSIRQIALKRIVVAFIWLYVDYLSGCARYIIAVISHIFVTYYANYVGHPGFILYWLKALLTKIALLCYIHTCFLYYIINFIILEKFTTKDKSRNYYCSCVIFIFIIFIFIIFISFIYILLNTPKKFFSFLYNNHILIKFEFLLNIQLKYTLKYIYFIFLFPSNVHYLIRCNVSKYEMFNMDTSFQPVICDMDNRKRYEITRLYRYF